MIIIISSEELVEKEDKEYEDGEFGNLHYLSYVKLSSYCFSLYRTSWER